MLRFGAYKREFKLVNDGNDRKTTLSDTKGDVEAAAEPAKSAGGFTKRQLWVAPLVMAVNLPGSVFAQVSPVGTPAPAPNSGAHSVSPHALARAHARARANTHARAVGFVV